MEDLCGGYFQRDKMEERTMKKRQLVLIIAMLFALCACGKGGNSFKVAYVGQANILSQNLYIYGEINGENKGISLRDAFKGYKVTNIAFPNAANTEIKGTEEGRLYFVDGVIATIEDDSGKSFEITIKEGSVFDVEIEGDSIYLLPPN